jgi:hypothetical protein
MRGDRPRILTGMGSVSMRLPRTRKHLRLLLVALGASSVLVGCGRSEMLPPESDSRRAGACGATTAPSWLRGPPDPSSLVVLDDAGSVFDVVPYGDRLLVGILIDAPIEDIPRGRIVTVAVGSGARNNRDLADGIPAQLQVAGPAVVYQLGVPRTIANAWDFYYQDVFRWDLQTDAIRMLEQPAGYAIEAYAAVTSDANGQVFWNLIGHQQSALAMWDPYTRQTSVIVEDHHIDGVQADSSRVYWNGWDTAWHDTMSSMPIGGGPVQRLYVSRTVGGDSARLWMGMDDESLYYTTFNDRAAGISSMPKTGGSGHTVVASADPWTWPRIDDAHVYWVDSSERNAVRRAPKSGGPTEVLWSEPDRWIQDVALDDCNVYWAVANPFEIFYRAK